MKRTRSIYLALLAVLLSPMAANADVILVVDLSVTDTITITATTGNSANTISGSDITGWLMTGFFDPAVAPNDGLILGNLTSALNDSDNSPNLFTFTQTGLNIFSTSGVDLQFIAGQQAFSGSASWTVDNASYLAALNGAGMGRVFFPADDSGDITNPDGQYLGTWALASVSSVPEPGTLALLGIGLVGMAARRRKTV